MDGFWVALGGFGDGFGVVEGAICRDLGAKLGLNAVKSWEELARAGESWANLGLSELSDLHLRFSHVC